jgi:hypothetical protein
MGTPQDKEFCHGQGIVQAYQKRKGTMKTSTNQVRNFRPAISKLVMALAVTSVMGAMAVTPALARDYDDRRGHRDNGRHRGERHDYRPVYRQPYYYSEPVYAPPPVYYAPQQSPGISIFLPLDIHRR